MGSSRTKRLFGYSTLEETVAHSEVMTGISEVNARPAATQMLNKVPEVTVYF